MPTTDCKRKKSLKIISILLAIMLAAILISIFNFSAQTASESSALSDWVVTFLTGLEKTSENMEKFREWSFYIRKAAHMTVFFACAITTFWLLFTLGSYFGKMNIWVVTGITMVYSFAMASLDEYHQSFVDGRGAAFSDVGIDMIGATVAIVLSIIAYVIVKQIIKKKRIEDTNE